MLEICEKHFPDELKRLQTIPGIKERAATSLIAEIGTDMSKFETANHLAAWSGLRPRNDESNKKVKSRKITPWQPLPEGEHHTMCMGCQSNERLFLQQVLLPSNYCKKKEQDEGACSHSQKTACGRMACLE